VAVAWISGLSLVSAFKAAYAVTHIPVSSARLAGAVIGFLAGAGIVPGVDLSNEMWRSINGPRTAPADQLFACCRHL